MTDLNYTIRRAQESDYGFLAEAILKADLGTTGKNSSYAALFGLSYEQARDAIAGVVALMRGEPRDLLEIRLDMAGVAAFERRVYELTRAIAPGHTRTYGEIARDMGEPGASRAVGRALGRNPFAPIVPCHRVLAAGGATGGFSANGGVATKMRMLLIEGARVNHTPDLFDQN